jgi:hypothetical protein
MLMLILPLTLPQIQSVQSLYCHMCILPTSLSTILITTLITTINHTLHYTITILITIPILTPHHRPSLDFKTYDWRWELRAADEKKKLQLKLMEYEKKKDGNKTPKP